ncbi:MAG: flagellin [Janthinobacterium lividum]
MNVTAAAGFTSRGLLGQLSGNVSSINQKLTQVGEEVSTGLVSITFAGLGSGAQTALNLRPQMAENDAISDGITAATSQMGFTQTVMTQIAAVAQSIQTSLSSTAGNSGNIDSIAEQARDAFSNVVGLLNSQDGDTYVFSGQDSGNPPVPSGNTDSFVAGVTSAVQALGTPGTSVATTEAGSLQASTSGVFSTTVGQATVQTVQTGQGSATTTYGVSANAPYMQQILQSLATIGALSSKQTGAAGYSTLVQDAGKQLASATVALTASQSVLGERQQELVAIQGTMASTKVSLATQLSSVEDADVASLATTQSLLQTQLQTSYKLIANAPNLSLIQYL